MEKQPPECIKLNREWQTFATQMWKKSGYRAPAPRLWNISTSSSPYASSSDDEGVEPGEGREIEQLKATGPEAKQSALDMHASGRGNLTILRWVTNPVQTSIPRCRKRVGLGETEEIDLSGCSIEILPSISNLVTALLDQSGAS